MNKGLPSALPLTDIRSTPPPRCLSAHCQGVLREAANPASQPDSQQPSLPILFRKWAKEVVLLVERLADNQANNTVALEATSKTQQQRLHLQLLSFFPETGLLHIVQAVLDLGL